MSTCVFNGFYHLGLIVEPIESSYSCSDSAWFICYCTIKLYCDCSVHFIIEIRYIVGEVAVQGVYIYPLISFVANLGFSLVQFKG